jgi:crotonobetainyl-CoA:carnitine CoA-transferase CaiB-like acyl-CoA transferase
MDEAILSELLVIDLSEGVAGAYCCLLLRHLGAEVVKLERPAGDSTRDALYLHLNAGKKSATLDIGRPEGAALLRRLADEADILVHDQPPERLRSLGLTYDTLAAQNPRLIAVAIASDEAADREAEFFAGANAFAAAILPLVNLATWGGGQEVAVDTRECLAAAAFLATDAPESDRATTLPEGRSDAPPFRMEDVAPLSPAPSIGEHNDEVYCGLLGLSGDELAALKAASAI